MAERISTGQRLRTQIVAEAIRRAPILDAYLAHKAGRKRLSDTYYEFTNRSLARAYGIMAQVDGGDLTIASLEEVDDMPADRLYSRFLLMLGASRRLGANKTSVNKPQIRITGGYKGADTLAELVDSGKYRVLPTIDAYLGIEMGILHENFIMDMRDQLAPDEYVRQILCKNVAARNFIWTKWVRQAIQTGIAAKFELAEPMPGEQYKKRGRIALGYDHSGHGEDPNASKSALVAVEQIGNFVRFTYARTWPAGTDERVIKEDLKAYWRYFQPDVSCGDAYGIGMLTTLNDELYTENLTTVDRRAIGEGESTATTWTDWAFAPLRFEGMVKHQMASAVRAAFSNQHAAMPYVDDQPLDDPASGDMRRLQQQLTNIRTEATSKAYSCYKMVKPAMGDDLFNAAMAAVWGLVTRGIGIVPSVIQSRRLSRQQLLGEAPLRLPSDRVSA